MMLQFSRQLGRASSQVHHGGVVAPWSCAAQKLPVEPRHDDSQAWAVTFSVLSWDMLVGICPLGVQDARGTLLPAPTRGHSTSMHAFIAAQ